MFGPFRPSASLSGGLLWKIPWRLSSTQKLRHRRRLRRVDNIVAVLDTALKRQAGSSFHQALAQSQDTHAKLPIGQATAGTASPEVLPTALEGQESLATLSQASFQEERRNVRDPQAGQMLPSDKRKMLAEEARAQGTIKLIERWKIDMPTEQEMRPKDKYTIFDRKQRGYRKGVHKLPKWTRLSQRLNPPGF